MAKINIKQNKDTVEVTVEVENLPALATEERGKRQLVTTQNVHDMLAEKNIKVSDFLTGPHKVSNLSGSGDKGVFVFSLETEKSNKKPETPKKELKPLTSEEKPAIIEDKKGKKLSKRKQDKSGTKTISKTAG